MQLVIYRTSKKVDYSRRKCTALCYRTGLLLDKPL